MVKNRHLDTILKVIVVSAIVHIIILIISAIKERSLTSLNYFNILDIHLLYPAITTSSIAGWLALLVPIILYIVIYTTFSKKK
ncbi:hypothetical protein GOV09_02755 [Candidatus Woesearchaeota archaeon]|nr:hypothetical protein [Candidatus Woesearchaeota archaeon]